MRPILLEIEGLQSYKEKQVIDFEKLCENGLFGIFGETGSGKSTILDAMILAIYGDIPRASELANEKNGLKNFLNTSSKKLEIYFKFALGEDIYEIKRKYALGKSKGQDELKTKEQLLIKNGEIIADSSTKIKSQIEEEFGLSIGDFLRTVVLPQGKFSEFVKLKGKDKRKMLEKIFAMERYGQRLQDRIRERVKGLKAKDKELSQEMESFLEVSIEKIQELETLRDERLSIKERKVEEEKEIEKKFVELNSLKKDFEEFSFYSKEKEQLDGERDDIEYKKAKLLCGRNANEVKKVIVEFEEKEEEKKRVIESLTQLKLKEEALLSNIDNLNKEIEKEREKNIEIQDKREKVDYSRDEEEKINEVLKNKEIVKSKDGYLKRIAIEVEELKEIRDKKNIELQAKRDELETKSRELLAFPEIDRESIDEYRAKIEGYQRVFESYQEKKQERELNLVRIGKLKEELESLHQEKIELERAVEELESKKRENLAYELAKDLKEGEPCPVCGSIHHMKLEHKESEDIEIIKKELKNLEDKKVNNTVTIGKKNGEIESLERNIERLKVYYEARLIDEDILKELMTDRDRFQKSLEEEEKRLERLSSAKKELEYLVKGLSESVKNIELELERLMEKNEKQERAYLELEGEICRLNSEIEKYGEEFLNQDIESLNSRREILRENYKKIEAYDLEMKRLRASIQIGESELQESKKSIDENRMGINRYEVEVKSLDGVIEKLKKQIDELMSKYNFITIEEIEDNCINEIEETSYTQDINSYEDRYQKVTILLKKSEENIAGKEFSIEKWEEIQVVKEGIKEEIVQLIEDLQRLNLDIDEMKKQLTLSKEKGKELKELRKELAIAEDLLSKFNSGGFVNYLTTRKLRGVMENASYYVNKITNGRYKLYTDDECDFYVIDVFNEGVKRRVGTLSGGEIFIVSLCLALALSKQLQLKGKVPLEFFFLDEGFGSLDSNLLDKVMEAIESIRREENINIGIITHLEDLKVRIDKKLQVEKAIFGERGTRVKII